MCVSGVRSGAVSCERVRVSCEWASRRSSVVRREAFWFALRFVWDSEVFVSCFEFEFLFRVCRRNFRFEFRVQVPWIFVSNFEFVFFVSLLNSISRISIFDSNFEFDFSNSRSRILKSNFEFVFFVSLLYLISRISIRKFRCSIRLLEFRVFDSTSRSSTSRFKCLEFRIRLDLFDFSNLICDFDLWLMISNLSSKLSFSCPVLLLVLNWRPQLFSHERFRFALVATRALRALFVRKILVKRQFTCSLYFGIIEL